MSQLVPCSCAPGSHWAGDPTPGLPTGAALCWATWVGCQAAEPQPLCQHVAQTLFSFPRWLTQKGARQKKINEWLGIKNETEE